MKDASARGKCCGSPAISAGEHVSMPISSIVIPDYLTTFWFHESSDHYQTRVDKDFFIDLFAPTLYNHKLLKNRSSQRIWPSSQQLHICCSSSGAYAFKWRAVRLAEEARGAKRAPGTVKGRNVVPKEWETLQPPSGNVIEMCHCAGSLGEPVELPMTLVSRPATRPCQYNLDPHLCLQGNLLLLPLSLQCPNLDPHLCPQGNLLLLPLSLQCPNLDPHLCPQGNQLLLRLSLRCPN
jgi:hypothetical protein